MKVILRPTRETGDWKPDAIGIGKPVRTLWLCAEHTLKPQTLKRISALAELVELAGAV